MNLFELENLRKHLRVSGEYKDILEKLFKIGEANLEENGVELIRKIKLLRGLTDQEICEICEIRIGDFENAISKGKISKNMALKLTKLGFPIESFK